MKNRASLERKMLSYFGLIAAASLLITLEFVYAIQTSTPKAPSTRVVVAKPDVSDRVELLRNLRNKALLMFAVQASVTLIVLVMFMRRITGPLQHMVETSRLIAEGDLSRTIKVRSADEIGLLGETINGLTSDIQEIVAFGMSTEAALSRATDRLSALMDDRPEARMELEEMRLRLDSFKEIVSGFKLFPAPASQGEVDRK